jgi:hypothetical protein
VVDMVEQTIEFDLIYLGKLPVDIPGQEVPLDKTQEMARCPFHKSCASGWLPGSTGFSRPCRTEARPTARFSGGFPAGHLLTPGRSGFSPILPGAGREFMKQTSSMCQRMNWYLIKTTSGPRSL